MASAADMPRVNLAPQTTTRVSRRELALNRYVWLATAAMFAILAVSNLIIAFLPLGFDRLEIVALSIGLGVVAAAFFFTEPAPVGSVENHLALSATYLGTSVSMLAFSPHTSVAIGAVMFVAPLTAMRLVDRREIVAHYLAATAFVIAPSVYAHVDVAGAIGLATVIAAMWVLGGCCILVFEAAESQGEELEDLVRRDPLTGLGNRRILTEELQFQLSRHSRTRRPLSVIAIDLNGFKALNDTLGHAAGDELLKEVAAALVDAMRPEDTVVRPGGDEFCIVLPGTSPEHAERASNAVRAALAGCGTGVTCGIGIASYPRDAVHDKVLLHVADERLLENKAAIRAGGGAAAALAASRASAIAKDSTPTPPTPGRPA
ncbi:MAG: diguanylate cyclase [Solirubrobacteraceae bacterium]|nr:diguanylate cyclase [Patulibacter sp.]